MMEYEIWIMDVVHYILIIVPNVTIIAQSTSISTLITSLKPIQVTGFSILLRYKLRLIIFPGLPKLT